MTRLKLLILFSVLLLVPDVTTAQFSYQAFWDGMKTALITLGTNPTQAYFDTLVTTDFPNRDQYLQSLIAEAHALTDMQVTYPIFIFDNARAAFQRVVTGTFTHPYVLGNTTLPPTNSPVRYVTQGMMDINGAGRITGEYSITDGFAKFQDFGMFPLAPGQEHGQIGLEPYAGDSAASAFAPGTSLFTHFAHADRGQSRLQGNSAGPEVPVTVKWFVGLGSGSPDAASQIDQFNQAHPGDRVEINTNFDSSEYPDGKSWLDFSANDTLSYLEAGSDVPTLPGTRIAAKVTQGDWTAFFAAIKVESGSLHVPDFQDSILITAEIEFPVFVFEHKDENAKFFQAFINLDTLGVLKDAGIDPETVRVTAPAVPYGSMDALESLRNSAAITADNAGDIRALAGFADDDVNAVAATPLTTILPQNESWLIQQTKTGIYDTNHGGVFGTVPAQRNTSTVIFDAHDQTVIVANRVLALLFDFSSTVRTTLDIGASTRDARDPNKGLHATAGADGFVRVYDSSGPDPLIALDTGDFTTAKVMFNRTGTKLITIGSNGTVRAWDTSTWEQQPSFESAFTVSSLALNGSHTVVVLGYDEGGADLFSFADGSKLVRLDTGTEPVVHLAFNSDDTTLLTFSSQWGHPANATVQLWAMPGNGQPGGENAGGANTGDQTAPQQGTGDSASAGQQTSSDTTTIGSEQQTSSDTTSQQSSQDSAVVCRVKAITNANIRSLPGASSERVDTLVAGEEANANGITIGMDGRTWYSLSVGGWIRSDLVDPGEGCEDLPFR